MDAFPEEPPLEPPKKKRKTTTCSCCGEPKVRGHSKVCLHTNRSCTTCRKESEADSRRTVLIEALRGEGCDLRSDSKLCKTFIAGEISKTRFSSAQEVARRMAEVRYLRGGYCEDYNKVVEETDSEVERFVERLAADCAEPPDWDGYYRGIYGDAWREVAGNGFYRSSDFENDLVENWKTFPQSWPWNA